MLKQIIFFLIKLYQKISPDHGILSFFFPFGVCRFKPTCSDYMLASIEKHGVLKGIKLGISRLARCHPFSSTREDSLPNYFELRNTLFRVNPRLNPRESAGRSAEPRR